MKRYRLLKDLPYAKSGCIFRWHKMTGGYAPIKIPNKSYEDDMRMSLSKEYVENNPEWFEPIPDTPEPEQTTKEGLWSDEDMWGIAEKVYWDLKNGKLLSIPLRGYVDDYRASKQSRIVHNYKQTAQQYLESIKKQ